MFLSILSLGHHQRSGLLAALSDSHVGSIPVFVSSLRTDDIDMALDTLSLSPVKTVLAWTTSDALESILYRVIALSTKFS